MRESKRLLHKNVNYTIILLFKGTKRVSSRLFISAGEGDAVLNSISFK